MSLSCLLWQLGDRIFLANASTCFNYTWTAVTRAVYKIPHFLSRQILWILCINLLFWPNKLLTKRDVQVSINLSIHLPRSKPLKSNAQLRPCLISAVRNLRKFFSLVLTLRGKKIPSPNPRCCGTDPTRIYHQLLCFSPLGFKNSTKRQLYA